MSVIDNYKEKLIKKIGEKRYNHCIRVCDTALAINKNYKINEQKIIEAAILHDCAKYNEEYYYNKYKNKYNFDENIIVNKSVSHAFIGFVVAKEEYNIIDIEVLNAIKYHTTGRPNMTLLEKIIFLADAIEPQRDYKGVNKLRSMAKVDLDKAILLSLDETIKFLINKKQPIFPLTIDTRNHILNKEKDE